MRSLGAVSLDGGRCRFRVWAPRAERVELHVVSPEERLVEMEPRNGGYHEVTIESIRPGATYRYRLNGNREFADPASRFQPEGVHGPSAIVPPDFSWTDPNWHGIPIERFIIYELHTGTFTREGTFDAIINHLDRLVDLGITAIELMPVAQFPGERNWGYDGVFPFAVQNTYGGPLALKRLVDNCHQRGLAVILDVVYNHLGPEGNYLSEFAPYFTDRYKTPWGDAINFDDAYSDDVREYFLQNAFCWISEFHFDALRLDAVHAVFDRSAETFLEELANLVHESGRALNRQTYAIAESALNDTRLIRPQELGGYGLDAQWNDDFHHSLHTLMTGEDAGYYVDFGDFKHMAQAFSEGFVYAGRYSVNRRRRHGNSSREVPPHKFVVFAQTHDQIGNRMNGERLSHLVTFEQYKLAAATVLLSPFVPMLFMGDEFGETAPFQYFVSHFNPEIIESVGRGRRNEFAQFEWKGEPPDPQDVRTFQRSKLNHELRNKARHRVLWDFHRELIRLRKSIAAFSRLSKTNMDVTSIESKRVLIVRRWTSANEAIAIFNFGEAEGRVLERIPAGSWIKRLDSADERWMGLGSSVPESFAIDSLTNLEVCAASAVLLERPTED